MPKKFVKAFCAAKNRHFGLDVEEFGGQYEVTNFIDISASEAEILPTQVNQTSFKVHNNLQSCWYENSRTVGSSSSPIGKGGCATGKYNFQCLYCRNLQIDRSKAKTNGQLRKGDVVHLSQGQEVAITGDDGEALKHILIGAGWDEEKGGHMDVDCSVILAGDDETELIYFGNKEADSGCVIHHGDNLTGIDSDTEGQYDEIIDIFLDQVPEDYDRIIIFYNIYSGQMLSALKNMYFRIADPDSGATLVDYRLHQGSRHDSAVVVATVKRDGDGWTVKAIDANAGCRSVHTLADELPRRY